MSTKTLAHKLSQPYAEALLEIAQKSNQIDKIREDVNIVLQVLSESNKLVAFFNNPLINVKSKKEIIKQLFSNQLSNEILVFMCLLIDRKRISYISAILNRYLTIVSNLESFIVADVIASNMFTDLQKQALINKLKEITGKKSVQLNISIDTTLIAGFTVQIGSKIIDTSLRGQLQEIGSFLGASKV
uniref:ATP synthase subunit delta, chloroplastic n=1 Tax=Trichogloeopsis pedicellata TaxID=1495610 RepID=A0A1G4P0I4_9FLOR|nr:ATP synthase CF1 subunit delta [Trichogloeopsis pedicellata]SCW24401.1 ATP synthase CF1 subunit delta [Trichogloeopsis pedicellata]